MARDQLSEIFVLANEFKEGDLNVGGTRDDPVRRAHWLLCRSGILPGRSSLKIKSLRLSIDLWIHNLPVKSLTLPWLSSSEFSFRPKARVGSSVIEMASRVKPLPLWSKS